MTTSLLRKPLDLPALVRKAMCADLSRDAIEARVIEEATAHAGRVLSEWERAKVGLEVALQANAREQGADEGESSGDLYSGDDE
jgi:hypothetical protein